MYDITLRLTIIFCKVTQMYSVEGKYINLWLQSQFDTAKSNHDNSINADPECMHNILCSS